MMKHCQNFKHAFLNYQARIYDLQERRSPYLYTRKFSPYDAIALCNACAVYAVLCTVRDFLVEAPSRSTFFRLLTDFLPSVTVNVFMRYFCRAIGIM